ncbi:MAG: aldo/keto reductase [Ethanoligenens sp.]
MSSLENIFRLGLGTNRFPIKSFDDEVGIDASVRIVLEALNAGVNYIDVAHTYSRGMAQTVLKRAFAQTNKPYFVTIKSSYGVDKTADDAQRRAETSLAAMGIDHAAFFVIWSIANYEEFQAIMRTDGLYDGAVKLKRAGIIDQIYCSVHASPKDAIKIIESGAFGAITISYSLISSGMMQPVLDAALKHNVELITMNPLGGGVIPQNYDYFSFARSSKHESTVQAALRFVAAQPAVKIVLSGVSSMEELRENLSAFNGSNTEPDEHRIKRVEGSLHELGNFCTGCNYCMDCPQGIPISTIMQSRNAMNFSASAMYGRSDPRVLKNIQLFREMKQSFQYIPLISENKCVRCRRCESRCTQKLNICDSLDDTSNRITESKFSLTDMKNRLSALLNGKNYKKVGFYPGGGYCTYVLELYHQFFGPPDFECMLFDSNPAQWGKIANGLRIYAPDDINVLKPDCILISNYIYTDEIYDRVKQYKQINIDVIKLHTKSDVPWVY